MSSARLQFRTWSAGDLPLALELWGDERVTRLIGGPFTGEQIRARLTAEIEMQDSAGVQYWPIFRLDDGAHVGCCGLRPWLEPNTMELGFHIRSDCWGRGYAREASQAVIARAWATGVGAVVAGHHPDNHRSAQVLEKLGFRYERDCYYPPTGRDHPTWRCSRDASRSAVPRATLGLKDHVEPHVQSSPDMRRDPEAKREL